MIGLKKQCARDLEEGYHEKIDSYSTFLENDKKTSTGLAGFLKEKDVFKPYSFVDLHMINCVFTAPSMPRPSGSRFQSSRTCLNL